MINIEYIPTEETLDYIYDTGFEVNLHWRVVKVQDYSSTLPAEQPGDSKEGSRLLNAIQQNDDDRIKNLIETDKIWVKYDFNQP